MTESAEKNFPAYSHLPYLCSHCRKTWQLQFTYTASQPG
ncbi:IS1 family transposase, partial [Escherichia coli]|nr:IS1 family transposase [Escherichia coli]